MSSGNASTLDPAQLNKLAINTVRFLSVDAEATRVQGQFICDVIKLNPVNFRVFCPDETGSNRWGAVFEVTNCCSTADIIPIDDHVAADGRVTEMFSQHQCKG